ncbi:MAG: hypothetical protein HYW78_04680, partial [Parcubacteria group bacterium]|nr:hypothetical protein [Parcubacteria group bacterium]
MDQEQQKLLDTITKIEEDSLENNFYAHCTLAQKGLPEEFYTLKKSVEELLRRQWT